MEEISLYSIYNKFNTIVKYFKEESETLDNLKKYLKSSNDIYVPSFVICNINEEYMMYLILNNPEYEEDQGQDKYIYQEISGTGSMSVNELKIDFTSNKYNILKGSSIDIELSYSINMKNMNISIVDNNDNLLYSGKDISNKIKVNINSDITINSDYITYTCNVINSKISNSKSIKINFCNNIFYGCSTLDNLESNIDDIIKRLDNKLMVNNKQTINLNAEDEEYIYYACPIRYGQVIFNIGGFETTMDRVEFMYTNENGYKEKYYLYKSIQNGLGDVRIEIQ